MWSGGCGAECAGRYGLGTLLPICLQAVQMAELFWVTVTCIGCVSHVCVCLSYLCVL